MFTHPASSLPVFNRLRSPVTTVLAAGLLTCITIATSAAAESRHKSKHPKTHEPAHTQTQAQTHAPAPAATPALCQLVDATLSETGLTAKLQRSFVAHGDLQAESTAPGQHCLELNLQNPPQFDGPVDATLSVLGMAMRTDHGTYNVTVDETGYAGPRPFIRYSVFAKNASVTHLGLQVILHAPAEPREKTDALSLAAADARYLTPAAADARYIPNDGREIVHFGDTLKLWHVPPAGPERGQNCLDFGLPQGTDTGKNAAVMSMEAVSCKSGEFSLRWQLHSATTPER